MPMHVDRLVFPSVDHPATSAGWSCGRCRSSTFFGEKAEEAKASAGREGHGQQFSALRIVTVDRTVIDKCGQAQKGAWWMSWHREATKDAAACDKLRGAGKRASIRRFLNAETRRSKPPSLPS